MPREFQIVKTFSALRPKLTTSPSSPRRAAVIKKTLQPEYPLTTKLIVKLATHNTTESSKAKLPMVFHRKLKLFVSTCLSSITTLLKLLLSRLKGTNHQCFLTSNRIAVKLLWNYLTGTRVWTAASSKYSVLMLLNKFQCHVTEIKEIDRMKVLESAELWD